MFLDICICDSCPHVVGSVLQSPFPDDARRVTWLMQTFIPSPTSPHPSPLPPSPLPPLPSNPLKHYDHGVPKTSCHRLTDIGEAEGLEIFQSNRVKASKYQYLLVSINIY